MSSVPKLSIVLPSIRDIDPLLESIDIDDFELIVCGPLEWDIPSKYPRNVKFVRDYGNPVRASQIAASLAEGTFITWIADDAVYNEGQLARVLDIAWRDSDKVTCTKYTEGEGFIHQPDEYFKLANTGCTNGTCFGDHWNLFNSAFMLTSVFRNYGGWDCSFETTFFDRDWETNVMRRS